jgi:hypothetical protein
VLEAGRVECSVGKVAGSPERAASRAAALQELSAARFGHGSVEELRARLDRAHADEVTGRAANVDIYRDIADSVGIRAPALRAAALIRGLAAAVKSTDFVECETIDRELVGLFGRASLVEERDLYARYLMWTGLFDLKRYRVDEAERRLILSTRIKTDDRRIQVVNRFPLAFVALAKGDYEEAQSLLDAASATAESAGMRTSAESARAAYARHLADLSGV